MAIEAEDAKQAGSVGFMARALTQATMPHRKAVGNEFVRNNGTFELTILSPSSAGGCLTGRFPVYCCRG